MSKINFGLMSTLSKLSTIEIKKCAAEVDICKAL